MKKRGPKNSVFFLVLLFNLSRKLRISGEPHKMKYTFFQVIFNSEVVTK